MAISMKSKTNKAKTEALKISTTTYNKVIERDNYTCVLCKLVGIHPRLKESNILSCHHYINRSHLGMGIEQNLVMLCYHHHQEETRYREVIKGYLMSMYDNWNEEDLIFRKGE
jgi:5-methylcytosine-specific restriction endonuclease McrA